MSVDRNSRQFKKDLRGFGGRIVLIVLAIITLSQVLGTFLSVISFEKIFLKALTYKYEILGKDLKRKIEQALKFGKPLDKFLGMDRLAEPLFRHSEDLNEIFLSDDKGKILFISGKVEFVVAKGITDEKEYPRGKVLLGNLEAMKRFPVHKLLDWGKKGPVTRLYNERYHVLFPIIPRYGGQKGILGLVFNKSVLDEKKKELIRSSRNKLGVAIILTAILVGLLIKYLFVAPVRRQVKMIAELLEGTPSPGVREDMKIPEEVLKVQFSVFDFISETQEAKKNLEDCVDILEENTPEDAAAADELRQMKAILKGKDNAKS
jgi:hypothetical protein